MLFLASWVLLFLLSVVVIVLSLNSLGTAYFGKQDQLIAGFGLEQLEGAGGPEAVRAFRGRRATAATWALGWGILYASMAFIPYRRKERWAWWALLAALLLPELLSLARYVIIGARSGAGASATLLAIGLLGLMMGVPQVFYGDKSELPRGA